MVIAIVLGHQSPWQDSTMWKLSNISFSKINANKLSLLIFFFVTQPLIWPRASRWTYSQLRPCHGWWETTMARLSIMDLRQFARAWNFPKFTPIFYPRRGVFRDFSPLLTASEPYRAQLYTCPFSSLNNISFGEEDPFVHEWLFLWQIPKSCNTPFTIMALSIRQSKLLC